MTSSGATSAHVVRPLLVDDDGRLYTTLYNSEVEVNNINVDGSGNQYVILSDGVNTVEVDPDIGGLLVTPIEHNLVSDGVMFSTFHSFLNVASATSKWVLFKTPVMYKAHVRFRFMSEAKIDYYVYENATLTGNGTAISTFDMNRETHNASNCLCYHTPTITNSGTMIDNGMIGTSGWLGDTGGSISQMADWIFRHDLNYLIGANNNDANAKDIVIQIVWFEEEV